MQYLASLLALAGAVAAQTAGFDAITSPGQDATLNQGDSFDITWQYNSEWPGSSKIVLIGGASSTTLDVVETVAASVENSAEKFTWKVDTSGLAVYGFQIIDLDDTSIFQYSFPFSIKPGTTTTSTSASTGPNSHDVTTSSTWGKPTTTSTSTSGSSYTKSGGGGWGQPTTTLSPTWGPSGNGSWTGSTSTDDCETETETSTGYWTTSTTTTGGSGSSPTTATTGIATAGAAAPAAAGGVALLGGLLAALAL